MSNLDQEVSSTPSNQQTAHKLKEEGNQFFKLKKFDRAIEIYSKCIELDPTCSVYYSNRSACYQNITNYKLMIRDAKQSIQLDPLFSKGHFRLAKGLIELKRFGKAYQVLSNALHDEHLLKAMNKDEKTGFESELNKCVQKLQEEQAIYEKIQELINPFSNMNNLNGVRRIEMEMRKEFYLNCFIQKEHKIVIIEKLDDILKPMKSIVKKIGNLERFDESQLNSTSEKDGKIILGEREQDLINEEYKNRALPTSCLNWRYQVERIEPILKELHELGIGILEICSVILVFFSRPEISCTILKRILKGNTPFLSTVENKVHAYILLAQSHLFWKGVPGRDIGLRVPTNKPLQYLRKALELLEQVEKKNYNSTVNHILVWTFITLIQQCCTSGDETKLSIDELEILMNDFYQLLFILDSSNLVESSHMNTICQEGIRFWFAHLQHQLGASDQFQRISLLPDRDVIPHVEKIFNEFHSVSLPLPKNCLNKFFLYALSESLLLKTNMEGFLRNIRLGLLSLTGNIGEKNTKSFLEPSMHSLHYALALQCVHNRYCFKKTENEWNLLKDCIQIFDEIVHLHDFSKKINLLEHSELHDLFLVISMYGSVADMCESFAKFYTALHFNHRDYPYLLSRLLNQTVRVPKKIKSLSDQLNNESENSLVLDYYTKSLSIIAEEDTLPNSSNMITSTLRINKEIEWMSNNEYWSQGFDQSKTTSVLLIKDAINLSDVKKYLQRYQLCTFTAIETSSNLHYSYLKDIVKSKATLMRAVNSSDILEKLYGTLFDVLETNSDVFKHEKTLQDLIQINLREGAIVKLALPSHFLFKFVKDVRNFLIQSLGVTDLLERDEFDNIPKLSRAPNKNELIRSRELLSLTPPFAEQFSKMSEFYDLNRFADLIFSPLWNFDRLGEVEHRNGFSFEQMSHYVEKTLGLRIIFISTNLMPFQGILPDYIEETKDVKCRDWRAMDSFANSHNSYFISPIHIVCEKPVKKVDLIVDRKKDPLGLKKYLHKLSNK